MDAVDQVVLNLQDEVRQSWKPGDQIVVASTDYSMHQAEEFTVLPCPHCTSRQVRIQGRRGDLKSDAFIVEYEKNELHSLKITITF